MGWSSGGGCRTRRRQGALRPEHLLQGRPKRLFANVRRGFFFPRFLLWERIPSNPLFSLIFQAEHLTSCYWGGSSNALDRHDPSLPYLEQYRIDFEQFKGMFALLFPWACGTHSEVLASRLFQLLDENGDSLINFREFVAGLSKHGGVIAWIWKGWQGSNSRPPHGGPRCCPQGHSLMLPPKIGFRGQRDSS